MSKKRDSRYVVMARLAYDLTKVTFPSYAHRNSPKRFTQPQLAACVLMMFYLGISYRDMEEWLLAADKVCEVLELSEVPDHSTLYRMYKRMRMTHLQTLNERLLHQLEVQEDGIAIDSTGFSLTEASQHYLNQQGKQFRGFVKGFYAVGIDSQMILAWRYDRGPNSDMHFLNRLRRAAHPFGNPCGWLLLADRAFDGQQARPHDLIAPRRGKKRIVRPDRVYRADLTAMARLDGLMGQRWKCETVFSVIKRLSGDTVRSRITLHQRREVAVKGLVYNLHR
jgi:transposase